MRLRFLLVWTLLFSLVVSTFGQQANTTNEQKPEQPGPAKQEGLPKKDDAVKISVTLVQVDVTVTDGKVKTFDGGAQQDFKRLVAGGSFQLGKELQPGDYVLQVIVADRADDKKFRSVSQWIDFEIVK